MTNIKTTESIIKRRPGFTELLPDFKRFAASARLPVYAAKDRREMLQHVHGDVNYLYATDSHRAIRIKRNYVEDTSDMRAGEFNYNVVSNAYAEGIKYPDVGRLFMERDYYERRLFIPYDRLSEIRGILNEAYKDARTRAVKNNVAKVEFKDGKITIKARGKGVNDLGEGGSIEDVIEEDATYSFWINSGYLRDALQSVNKLKRYTRTSGFYIDFKDKLRPIQLTDGALYNMLLLPIRIY